MAAAYADADVDDVEGYLRWKNFATAPYQSATHGSRYVNNYANETGDEAYGKYEDVGTMPAGSILAKDSFVVHPDGAAEIGPLFIMEKVKAGALEETNGWRYQMIMPNGTIFGTTGRAGSSKVQFCAQCHSATADSQDSLFFMPEEFRVGAK